MQSAITDLDEMIARLTADRDAATLAVQKAAEVKQIAIQAHEDAYDRWSKLDKIVEAIEAAKIPHTETPF